MTDIVHIPLSELGKIETNAPIYSDMSNGYKYLDVGPQMGVCYSCCMKKRCSMKTIATKYIAPLVLTVGITGGFVGFELSQAFTLSSSEKNLQRDDLSRRQVEKTPANPAGPQGNDDKRPPSGPQHPTPIL